jgi:membrane protease YdiL (CAAX protease family)
LDVSGASAKPSGNGLRVGGIAGQSLAPWWHTVFVLIALGALFVVAGYQGGYPNAHIPGLGTRVSSYLTIMVAECLLVLVVWLGVRSLGHTIADLGLGTAGRFFKDLGLAVAFLVVIIGLEEALFSLLHASPDSGLQRTMPTTASELVIYLVLAVTGGLCEELIFRGYLQQQFTAWSRSPTLGIVLQGVLFGLGHAYYGAKIVLVIMVHGCFLGLLTHWRRSLRPAILAHGLQNMLGGVVSFVSG